MLINTCTLYITPNIIGCILINLFQITFRMSRKMYINKLSEIDLYFHMANHYKKLRSVKSVVNTGPLKSSRISDRRGRTATRNEPAYATTPSKGPAGACPPRVNVVKKVANCNGTCESYARSNSMPARPPTRRNPCEMPPFSQAPTRAKSTGPVSVLYTQNVQCINKSKTPTSSNANINQSCVQSTQDEGKNSVSPCEPLDPKMTNSCGLPTCPPVPAPRGKKACGTASSFSAPDHEYLQFSLRITEDIIRNDLYTNKEMRRVFNSHIEANRGRLDLQKMKEQIEKLSKELNIPLDEESDVMSEEPSRHDIKRSRQNIQSSLSCRCGPIVRPLNAGSADCACDSKRCLPFQCVQPCIAERRMCNEENVMKKISYDKCPAAASICQQLECKNVKIEPAKCPGNAPICQQFECKSQKTDPECPGLSQVCKTLEVMYM